MRETDPIDAEFEVVHEPGLAERLLCDLAELDVATVKEIEPRPERLGLGYFSVPTAWLDWDWYQKVFYVVFYGAWLIGLGFFAAWLRGVLPLPNHW